MLGAFHLMEAGGRRAGVGAQGGLPRPMGLELQSLCLPFVHVPPVFMCLLDLACLPACHEGGVGLRYCESG